MHRVVVADPLAPAGLEFLREAGVQVVDATEATRAELEALVGEADGLLVRSRTRVDRALLERGRRLRVVGRAGTGVDNVDLETATARGVLVFNVPGASLLAATEHTLALLLVLARNVAAADTALKAGNWDRKRFLGMELHGKTLGIVGLGRIGQQVAARARAFGMTVVAHDPFLEAEVAERSGVPLLALGELLSRSDMVTLHLPLTAKSQDLIGAPELARMKPGALLVNCARGGIVSEAALLEVLEEGRLGGAALDVFEMEPTPNAALIRHPRVVATPHLGAQTLEAQHRASVEAARTLLEALSGSLAVPAVNLPFTWPGHGNLSPLILAEQLGRLASSLAEGIVRSLTIELWGFDELLHRPLTLGACRGALLASLGESVGYVNVEQIVASRGIELVRVAHAGTDGYANLIGISLSNGSERIELSGTLFDELRPRVVRFGQIPLEFAPEGRLLVLRSQDQPGVIGKVGTLLGEAGVNIADVHLAREDGKENAWTVLRLDQAPGPDLLERLAAQPALRTVRLVDLGHPWPARTFPSLVPSRSGRWEHLGRTTAPSTDEERTTMSELPYKLSKGDHKVIYRPIRDDARGELKAAIDRKYVHVKFTETRGGTELGFPLDEERSDLSKADWEAGTGSVHLEGELNLDGVPVRCVADIDLSTVEGLGHLDILEEEKGEEPGAEAEEQAAAN